MFCFVDAMAYLARQKLALSNQQGSATGSGDQVITMQDGVPTQLITRIDDTVKEYSTQFDILMNMLKDEVSNTLSHFCRKVIDFSFRYM